MKTLRYFLAILAVCFFEDAALGQFMLYENFVGTLGHTVTEGGWSTQGGFSLNPVEYSTPGGLTYGTCPGSGVGNAATLDTIGDAVYRSIAMPSVDGSMYVSFLLNVSTARTGDFFIALSPSTDPTIYYARVYLKSSGAGYVLGIRKCDEGSDAAYGSTVWSLNTTYLVVVKYRFFSGTKNDSLSLFVLSDGDLPATEPATAEVGPYGAATRNDASDLFYVTLLQRSATASPALVFDALRIGGSWDEAPLPVELSSFSGTARRLSAHLVWSTATEVNGLGFVVERRALGDDWSAVGEVRGDGPSNANRTYRFMDQVPIAGVYEYRIKQSDLNGVSRYSQVLRLEVGTVPLALSLSPNFPNPFNPTTSFEFSVLTTGRASLRVFNMLGQEVATLYDGEAISGSLLKATFNAGSLPSGVYYCRLASGGTSLVRKLVLAK